MPELPYGVDVLTKEAKRPAPANIVLRRTWREDLIKAEYKLQVSHYEALRLRNGSYKSRPAYRTESKPRRCTGVVLSFTLPNVLKKMKLEDLRLLVTAVQQTMPQQRPQATAHYTIPVASITAQQREEAHRLIAEAKRKRGLEPGDPRRLV